MYSMMVAKQRNPEVDTGHIRPFDVRSDLLAVSDLVEVCFADRLSRDGEALLRKMRASAGSKRFQQWAHQVAGRVSMPFTGYVWVEEGEVVGNLSLIPYHLDRRDFYMIANVAVHPQYQRQGIGRALVRRALRFLRPRGVDGIWLQVDENNQAAISLYQQEGFREQTRRTTWYLDPNKIRTDDGGKGGSTPVVNKRKAGDWHRQRQWLRDAYPAEVRWHLPLKLAYLRGGMLGWLTRMLYVEVEIRQWSVRRNGMLEGVVSWQSSKRHSDWLWLAAPRGGEEKVLRGFLPFLLRAQPLPRRVRLDYPAERGEEVLQEMGFSPSRTLIWMRHIGQDFPMR